MVEYNAVKTLDGGYIITVEGHANTAPKGADVVCAAASALTVALVEASRRMLSEGRAKVCRVALGDGYTEVELAPESGEEERAAGIVNTITDAFVWLEYNYPDFVAVV